MATVTYDGQSFMIDGRRIWLVGGQIDYARTPRAEWADRLHAARSAGLNLIATSIPWCLHEPRSGQFDFEGQHDLRHFLKLAHAAGLWCLLRLGPYIGDGWDMGGMPHWLATKPDVRLRAPSQPLLEACSRFVTAVAEQARDLQITSSGEGGPIILVQNESRWTCGDEAAAQGYLGELVRYAREAGFNVPVVNANNLWQGVEGEIDGWVGGDDMLPTLRQLAAVQPDKPRLIVELTGDPADLLGRSGEPPRRPETVLRRLAETLAGRGQFVMAPFAAGITPGFYAGRRGLRTDDFTPSTSGARAPIGASGAPGDSFGMVRRICTFASTFARVFAGIDPSFTPATIDQRAPAGANSTSLVDLRGTQGSVLFAFGEEPSEGAVIKPRDVDVLLADGSSLTIPIGRQGVGWAIFDVLLGSRTRLDFCTLNAFALVGSVLVCFGPAGAHGSVSLNGSVVTVEVPRGKQPATVEVEGYTVIVAAEELIDEIHMSADAIYIGVAGVTATGQPVPLPGGKSCVVVSASGEKSKLAFQEAPAGRAATGSVPLEQWDACPAENYVAGASPRYAGIDGPGPLSALGAPFGYGWYKIDFRSGSARKPRILAPRSRDRLHLFLDGEPVGVMGYGPAASFDPMPIQLKKGEHTLVVLAENAGRPSAGMNLDELKGLVDHFLEVKAFRAGRHKTEQGERIDLLSFRSPLWNVRPGDRTHPDRLTWSFSHRRKSPVILSIDELASRVLLILNGKPHSLLDAAGPTRITLDHEALNRGGNSIQLALVTEEPDAGPELARLASSTTFLEGAEELTGRGRWSFAKWEPPPSSAYVPLGKSRHGVFKGPTWYRIGFELRAAGAPVRLELTGLSRGQIILNGVHVGRYSGSARAGGAGEEPVLLPAPILSGDGENELVLFDEHGASPLRARLLIERGSHPIRA